jgi:hypothetical protein
MKAKSNNRNIVGGAMRLALAMTMALLLTSCAATVVKIEPPQMPAISVLIVTDTGMVPASTSDPHYEQTWLQVSTKYIEVSD